MDGQRAAVFKIVLAASAAGHDAQPGFRG